MNEVEKDQMAKAPRRRDREASSRALLDAGIAAFAAHGYDAATTRDIAARAGLNDQLITRYFGGKAGLLVAIYEDFLKQQGDVQAYTLSAPHDTVVEEIEAFLLAKHAHFMETQKMVLVLVPRLLIDPEARAKIDMALLERATGVLAERLKNMQRKGKVREDINITRISDSIAFQSFGASFIGPAIRGTAEDIVLAQLREFAAITARGIAANADET